MIHDWIKYFFDDKIMFEKRRYDYMKGKIKEDSLRLNLFLKILI
jgi:hypothetical protein